MSRIWDEDTDNNFQLCRLAANIFTTSSCWPPTREYLVSWVAASSPSCKSNNVIQNPIYGFGLAQILFVTSRTQTWKTSDYQ